MAPVTALAFYAGSWASPPDSAETNRAFASPQVGWAFRPPDTPAHHSTRTKKLLREGCAPDNGRASSAERHRSAANLKNIYSLHGWTLL